MIHVKLFCNNLGGDLEIFPGLFQGKCLFHSLPGFPEFVGHPALWSKQIYRNRGVCKSCHKKNGYKLACSGKRKQRKKTQTECSSVGRSFNSKTNRCYSKPLWESYQRQLGKPSKNVRINMGYLGLLLKHRK